LRYTGKIFCNYWFAIIGLLHPIKINDIFNTELNVLLNYDFAPKLK